MPISSRFVVRSSTMLLTVALAALIIIVGMTIWLNARAERFFEAAVSTRQTKAAAVELRDALRTAESSQRGYILTGNEIYLAPLDNAKATVAREYEALKRQAQRSDLAEPMLQRLATVIDEKLKELDETVTLKGSRKEAEVRAIVETNRGKALMDEANVFLLAIILDSDEKLSAGEDELKTNAALLRFSSIAGGLIIILFVSAMLLAIFRYTRETVEARDEVRALNSSLEERVAQRTSELMREKDRAEVLLSEVNHRVANSLAIVVSLIRLQSNSLTDEAAKNALKETQARIYAIEAVHRKLYTSGDVRSVALNEYLSGLLQNLEASMHAEGYTARLDGRIEAVDLNTDRAVNLGIILTEWVTNAFKYAYPKTPGEIRVRLSTLPAKHLELVVEDDGVGRKGPIAAGGSGFGTRIVKAMATSLNANIEYGARTPGTSARLVFAAS